MTDDYLTELQPVLDAYVDYPMRDGDVVFLVFADKTCVELAEIANRWDAAMVPTVVARLGDSPGPVLLAIARNETRLRTSDHSMWEQLRSELLPRSMDLLPLRALPAA